MNFEEVLVQVFQPYFYYSIIILAISFVCVKIIVKYCPFLGSKTKSLIYLIPVVSPLFVMLSFYPKIVIQTVSYHLVGSFSIPAPNGPMLFSPVRLIQPSSPQTMVMLVTMSTNQIFSITGIICLIGLAFGGIYAITTIVMGDWIASKLLHVINLRSNEYEWLQSEIAIISKKLAISAPRISLVEDLRPNAFTMGYSHKTTLVFTVGLLNLLDKEGILAVASHELAHIKNHDFFFKTLSNALTAVSFFNPLAYFAFFNSQREREMLADENGASLLQKPDSLANALTKISAALQNLPRESRLIRITSNLLVTSPIIHRPQILSAHPKIDLRLRNINQLTKKKPKQLKLNKLIAAIILTCVIITAGVTTTYALVNLQSGYVNPKTAITELAYIKGANTDSISSCVVLISSNTTNNPVFNRISSFESLNPHVSSIFNPAQLNGRPYFGQNQAGYVIPNSPPLFLGANFPYQTTIIYLSTSQNGTALIVKY